MPGSLKQRSRKTGSSKGDIAASSSILKRQSASLAVSGDDPTTGANPSDGDLPGLEGSGNEYSPQRSYTGREPDAATGLIYCRVAVSKPERVERSGRGVAKGDE
jgi:hypothetical protein